MAKVLEKAVAYGAAMAVEKMYASVSQSVTQPSEPTKAKTKAMPKYGKGKEKGKSEEKVEKKKIRGKRQPPEEEDGRVPFAPTRSTQRTSISPSARNGRTSWEGCCGI